MADFTNAQKLAAIISEWARPAISQIASSKITSMGWVKSLQGSIMSLGLVGNDYNIAADIQPLLNPVVSAIVEPMLVEQFSKLPDQVIPQVARSIIDAVSKNGSLSLLNGLIVLEAQDIDELQDLVEKNLPCGNVEHYNIVR